MKFRTISQMAAGASLALGLSSGGAAASTAHTVLSVILDSGNPGSTLATGYNTMETGNVQCPRTTCTIGMTIMSAVSKATCSEEWQIVGLVDGTSVDGGVDQDVLPSANDTQTRNWQGIYQVAKGKHTIAFQLNVPCAVNADQWSVNYIVTTP